VVKVSTGSLYLKLSERTPSIEIGVFVKAEVGSSGSDRIGEPPLLTLFMRFMD
jgi:hypothetical protein